MILSIPFAIYIGVVLGGNLGARFGWELAKSSAGIVFGILVGFFLVAGAILLTGAILGGVFGLLIERILR